jgi:hypothetical protein
MTNMGEHLLAAIVNESRTSFFDLCSPPVQVDNAYVESAESVAFAEVPLCPFGQRRFDPMSRVDLVVRSGLRVAVPFELKLGKTRLTRAAIGERLGPCKASKHEDARWRGNMMGILNYAFVPACEGELAARLGDGESDTVTLTRKWYLIARRVVVNDLRLGQISPHMGYVVFEDIVGLVGNQRFDEIVREHLPDNFYQAWVEE